MAPVGEYETYATFPTSGATENITQGADGAIYVTGMDDKVVWRVTSDGMVSSVERFATIPGVAAVVGVAPDDNGLVVTAFAKPFRLPPAGGGPPQINLSDVGPEVIVIDKTGAITATIPGQKGQAFNGIVCSRRDLDIANPTADPGLARLARQMLDAYPQQGSDKLTVQVRVRLALAG